MIHGEIQKQAMIHVRASIIGLAGKLRGNAVLWYTVNLGRAQVRQIV